MENLNKILKNWRGRRVLMAVLPHPDDEVIITAGLLLAAKKFGWKTIVITLTGGEAGKLNIPVKKGMTVRECRGRELAKAIKILKVDKSITADFGDGRLKEKQKEIIDWLAGKMKEYQPEIIVSHDPAGISGHPDHIASCLATQKAIRQQYNQDKKPMLLWASVPMNLARRYRAVNKKVIRFLSSADHELNLGASWMRKLLALSAHRSQFSGKNEKFAYLFAWMVFLYRREWYHLAEINKDYPCQFIDFKL